MGANSKLLQAHMASCLAILLLFGWHPRHVTNAKNLAQDDNSFQNNQSRKTYDQNLRSPRSVIRVVSHPNQDELVERPPLTASLPTFDDLNKFCPHISESIIDILLRWYGIPAFPNNFISANVNLRKKFVLAIGN